MTEEKVPPNVSQEARWIVNNTVTAVRVEYRMRTEDTAETYVHLKNWEGKEVCWLGTTFNQVAQMKLGYNYCAEPKYGVVEAVRAREAYEKKNAKELAEWKRLNAKFGGIT